MSKAALNAAGVSLAHDLKGDGMSVAILHPGMPRTTRNLVLYARRNFATYSVLHVEVIGLNSADEAADGFIPPRNHF